VYGQCKSWLDQGLQPRAVTRDLDWGVKVPLPNTEGKVLYVWFDAPIGYISATKAWASANNKNWEDYWKRPDTQLIHFIGKDNIVFHCLIFPTILMAAEDDYIWADQVPANEFLNLEGNKISTSRNWAVWLHEYLVDFPNKQDVLRYVLAANMPETKDNDFTWKDFQARNNNELVAILGNFVNRVVSLTHKYFDGKVPSPALFTDQDMQLVTDLATYPDRIENSLKQFRFREAMAAYIDLARTGNKYLAETEPWKIWNDEPERVATILNLGIQIVANLALLGQVFLPETAISIFRMVPTADMPPLLDWKDAGSALLVDPGTILGQPHLLFEKIEDETVLAQVNKLEQTKEQNLLADKNPEPVKASIAFEDFQKMDIRVATITAAELVPKTKKLLKLTLDTGVDTRIVVSGIAEHYKPEEIIGQQVCLLANLAAREMKGILTEGMILMAEDKNGKLVFVNPAQSVWNGAEVR
jgi:methionyl-tRNA synthetase